jgi:hypothetical protein
MSIETSNEHTGIILEVTTTHTVLTLWGPLQFKAVKMITFGASLVVTE